MHHETGEAEVLCTHARTQSSEQHRGANLDCKGSRKPLEVLFVMFFVHLFVLLFCFALLREEHRNLYMLVTLPLRYTPGGVQHKRVV